MPELDIRGVARVDIISEGIVGRNWQNLAVHASASVPVIAGACAQSSVIGVVAGTIMWRKNPIPHIINQWDTGGPAFEPPCQESEACKALSLRG